MADSFDFEARLEQRLRARADRAVRPFDAGAIAHQAIATGDRRRGIGRLAWPFTRPSIAWLIVVLLLVIAFLGALSFAGGLLRQAPPSGVSNGRVAFVVQDGIRGGDSAIYLVSSGVPERRLVGSEGYGTGIRAACPSFSPDGTRLAYFEASVTPTPPATGSNQAIPGHFDASNSFVVLTRLDPTGSPTGSAVRIAVAAGDGDACPKWAPDGKTVAFLTNGQTPQLWIGRLDGTETQIAVGQGIDVDGFFGQSDWSPDGTAVVVVGNVSSSIWIVPIDRAVARLLVQAGPDRDFEYPVWSPDGTRIALLATTYATVANGRTAVGSAVEVYRADGTGSTIELAGGRNLTWSPDGHRLAYVRTTVRDGVEQDDVVTVAPELDDVRVVASEASSAANLNFISGLTWSPDGTRMLYAADEGVSGRLVSVSAVGDPAPIVLTQQPHDFGDTDLSWQPVFQ